MIRIKSIVFVGMLVFVLAACQDNENWPDRKVVIPDFNYPETIVFEQSLSAYNIYKGTPKNLIPSGDFHLLELSSILFTDHAHKQRLVKLPEGTQMRRLAEGSLDFPDGAILVKTFYYYLDERDTSLGKNIIESRVLIKKSNTWNIATYVWNEQQTDASLELNGADQHLSWINLNGSELSTKYHVPSQNECITCHQSNSARVPIGPGLRNLNRTVLRNGRSQNQLSHLQSSGLLSDFEISLVPEIVDYNDRAASIMERGRAYLDLNCAHCHNPTGWDASSERDFDFRYETELNQTGILHEKDRILEAVNKGEMPFIGTTILDHKGISLINQFVEGL